MSAVIELKALSSLEKCFLDERLCDKTERKSYSLFRNQRLTFQIGMQTDRSVLPVTRFAVRAVGDLAAYTELSLVTNLPSVFPCLPDSSDDGYLRKEPGLYPDLIRPLHYHGAVALLRGQLQSLWVEVRLPQNFPAGSYQLTVEFLNFSTKELCASQTVSVYVADAELPPQKLIRTEWFYTDCLAEYYHVPAFSEEHWRIIGNFLRMAVQNGINMILTPVFTPELDTYIGGERLTTQLLDIEVTAPGKYRFGFDKLERWVDLCLSLGVSYFEIPHFFTQWGSLHAPKFVALVNGTEQQIFGWETDSCGEEYRGFLAQMIPALVEFSESKGIAERTYFHISDEPRLKDLGQYRRCKEMVAPYLKGYPIIDALSDYEFFESGALEKPIPAIKHIRPFLEHQVQGLWAYYCGASSPNTTGRMLAMPLSRTRILGVQLYLEKIEGFLHWGYNYYNNQYSYDRIDPFLFTDGEYFAPSGDTCLVYPGDGGEAWGSLRLNALREAMEDIRMLELCESEFGRAATEKLIRDAADCEISFTSAPADSEFFLRMRDHAIALLESAK